MNASIEVNHLVKRFAEGINAVDNVSFSVTAGQVYGFLGPNGAGKSTTVRLVNGVLKPTDGSIELCGLSIPRERQEAMRLSGVMTENAGLYEQLSGHENLDFFARMHDLPDRRERVASLLRDFGLEEAAARPVKQYSTGMKRRLALSRALLHRPRVLFLDEPSSGLDPEAAREVHQLIRGLADNEGVTVFMCTHQLKYAQEICDSYGLLHKGKLLANGTLSDLASQLGLPARLRLRLGAALPSGFAERHGLTAETAREGKAGATPAGNLWTGPVADDAAAAALLRELVQQGTPVYELSQSRPGIEDVYFALVSKEARQEDRT